MKTPKHTIRLEPDEDQFLRDLHRQSGIPDGQFPQRPTFWRRFTDDFNEATDRSETPEDLLHYIVTRRKYPKDRPGRWPTFDGTHKRLATPPDNLLTPDQWAVVDELYIQLAVGADNFLFDRESRRQLHKRFVARTGQHFPELTFAAAVIARRKAGLLPTIPNTSGNQGFKDIDKVA